jgi:hypothetical protein
MKMRMLVSYPMEVFVGLVEGVFVGCVDVLSKKLEKL